MQDRTAEHLQDLVNSILATEDPSLVEVVPAKDRLLDQIEGLGRLERLARVALEECAVELRREKVTWTELAQHFGSSQQSAYGRWREAEVRDQAQAADA